MSAQDEVDLAKKLVASVLKETVPWPGPNEGIGSKSVDTIYKKALKDDDLEKDEGEEEEQQKWTLSVAYTTYPIISQ
jgi:hypothetical protein